MSETFHTLEGARSAADAVFLMLGVVPLVLAVAVLLLGSRKGGEVAP